MPLITTRVTAATDATTKNAPLSNAEIDQNFINLNNAITLTQDVTGFADRTSSTITFNNLTRTLSLSPVGANFSVYFRGKEFIISATKNLTLTNSNGGRYIGYNYNTGNLEDLGANPVFANTIMVAYVWWSISDATAIIFADERHSVARDTTWHKLQHETIGAIWKSGGDATYTVNNTNTVQIGFNGPIVLVDEDIEHSIIDGSTGTPYVQTITNAANLPILYLSGTTYRQVSATTIPWYPSVTRAYYNPISAGNGSLATASANDMYICYWVVLTNDSVYPLKLVMGRGAYTTYGDAETENFEAYGLPMPEIAPMYKIILKTSDTYTQNTARVSIVGFRELVGKQNSRSNSFDTMSHDALSDRFLADQHSISSITGLQTTLDSVSGASVAMAIALG
jgi:hypothetical protein